jgi:cobalt-precorrin-5B (C1)-methyltransferase
VLQSIDVAAANSLPHVVLTTGGRSERFAGRLYPTLPEMAFVQMGIFTGDALRRARDRGVPRVTICGMIGKLAKLAMGQMQTHVAGGGVDCAFLARACQEAGGPAELVAAIGEANTARHVEELIDAAGFGRFYQQIAVMVAAACQSHAGEGMTVEAVLFDFDGKVLGRAGSPPECPAP